MSIKSSVNDFLHRVQNLFKGGGETALEKQKERGKLTARERVSEILDEGSFLETDLFVEHSATDFGMDSKKLAGDGVITGYGSVSGRPVAIFAQDFTVAGGSLGKAHAAKITKVMDGAGNRKIPLIGINDSGGARIQEGVDSLCGYGDIFYRNTRLSGVVPQLSLILGPCAGGAVYSPALTDFVFVVNKISNMFITGPQVIKTVLGEDISQEELGGAKTHTSVTGNAHFYAESEQEAFGQIKRLLGFLPASCMEDPPVLPPMQPRKKISHDVIPDNRRKAYDVVDIIQGVADGSDFLQVHEHYARNIVVGFARINGKTTGIIANQPKHLAGVLDVNASDKAARFIRFCDAFRIPLLTFVDTPGYLPGVDQEHSGVIRHGAKLLYSYSEASVPKVTVIMRKAYGGAYIAMCSRHLGASSVIAWPTAEIAVMGAEGAANIVFRKEISESDDPERTRQEKVKEYEDKFANPYVAASKGYVDLIIDPEKTRETVIRAFDFAGEQDHGNSFRRHGNIPL
ncbi:MAG TPA: acyl-CoA carboxylase subunit beta [Candidatus Sabulitectum sp.]|nr:acyl-CoA carboxylase subunit beta [Candidatus Sabulitectum sp.]HPF32743.1 acyl-CoA carboxylase subunit beta [Candidatus Sabulitectum sp.]HPJ28161.1 acyl-CoA carboxylase subunit beta [Candidatus Sabulitectum sp.]HPR21827.1 acyl-CoA carboxylase subunit beta [Candidatus Sabulitectum sp.]